MTPFKVGDRVVVSTHYHDVWGRKGWTGEVKAVSSDDCRVRYDHDGDFWFVPFGNLTVLDEPFDPHALGMALKLADLLANECVENHGRDYKADWSDEEDRHGYVSDWLRTCVTHALLSHGGER